MFVTVKDYLIITYIQTWKKKKKSVCEDNFEICIFSEFLPKFLL